MGEYEPQPVDDKLRPCFCFLWNERRELLEKLELPYGFCGWCESCREPGHVRQGLGPTTGAWCDECWEELVRERVFQGRVARGPANA